MTHSNCPAGWHAVELCGTVRWLTHDGGPDIDGPVLLTDEPMGDAMRWAPEAETQEAK